MTSRRLHRRASGTAQAGAVASQAWPSPAPIRGGPIEACRRDACDAGRRSPLESRVARANAREAAGGLRRRVGGGPSASCRPSWPPAPCAARRGLGFSAGCRRPRASVAEPRRLVGAPSLRPPAAARRRAARRRRGRAAAVGARSAARPRARRVAAAGCVGGCSRRSASRAGSASLRRRERRARGLGAGSSSAARRRRRVGSRCRRRRAAGVAVAPDGAVGRRRRDGVVERLPRRARPASAPRPRGRGPRRPGGRLLAPAPRAAALALGEVAQQLARERAGLAGQARAGAAQDLLGLGRVRHRGGEQRGLQAAVLLARGVHEPARVARVRAAAGVHEQPEQALGLRPALDRVLLVDLARVLGQAPDPGVGLVAAADALLGQRLEHDLGALAALLARPACR